VHVDDISILSVVVGRVRRGLIAVEARVLHVGMVVHSSQTSLAIVINSSMDMELCEHRNDY